MENAVVIYNSKSGNTKAVGLKIAEGLGCRAYSKKEMPKDFQQYNLVVVGSWMAAGMLKGGSMFKKIAGKYSGKVALFFTSGGPEEENPMAKKQENQPPKLIKDSMWEKMEKKFKNAADRIEILEDRFYCKGDIRFEKKKEDYIPKHPSEEDLRNAFLFGQKLNSLMQQ